MATDRTGIPGHRAARVCDHPSVLDRGETRSVPGKVADGAALAGGSVLAVVPQLGCQRWLAQCLDSLVHQTRPLDGIVVIDDGRPGESADEVRRRPEVTLLASRERVGPYRLLQQVIDGSEHPWLMLQDADDWSTPDRLELQLAAAARHGADLVGCQELRIDEGGHVTGRTSFPLDANRSLAQGPSHALLHPTSLLSRTLVRRVGGFATGLRFAADTEFLWRAAHCGRIVNIPELAYARRIRAGSLTSAPETAQYSPARQELLDAFKARARANLAARAAGEPPDLTPHAVAGPIELVHVAGPPLRAIGEAV